LQTAEEEEEDENEVTGLSSQDLGLQARALYDYQAGKFHIDIYLSLLHQKLTVQILPPVCLNFECMTFVEYLKKFSELLEVAFFKIYFLFLFKKLIVLSHK
jgi:hypothetical protein